MKSFINVLETFKYLNVGKTIMAKRKKSKKESSNKFSQIILLMISILFIIISAVFLFVGIKTNSGNTLSVSLFFMLFAIWAVLVYMLIRNAMFVFGSK